jgi:sigma-B regulation protein RsbU (phosphoserine phosphatase)
VTVSHILNAGGSASSLLIRTEPDSLGSRIVPPREVVEELNQRFQMEDSGGSYFTLVYGVLEVETRRFRYVTAGHPPILRLSLSGEVQWLEGGGFAIGWDVDFEFDEHEIQLHPGDRLCIYSDGVPEAMNRDLEPFGNDRLLTVWQTERGQDLTAATETLRNSVELWCGDSGPKDDISILAVEVAAQQPGR